jgi:hypothetical protein
MGRVPPSTIAVLVSCRAPAADEEDATLLVDALLDEALLLEEATLLDWELLLDCTLLATDDELLLITAGASPPPPPQSAHSSAATSISAGPKGSCRLLISVPRSGSVSRIAHRV